MKQAFTLIELLVVIAVVGVLAGFSIPIYQRITEGSRAVACLSNLRQLGTALSLYLGEHNATMPIMSAARAKITDDEPAIDTVLLPYIGIPAILICPGDKAGNGAKTGTSYFWNSALNGQSLAALSFFFTADTSHIPLLFDKDSFHPYETNKVNFLYADGHATKEFKLTTSP